MSDLFAERTLLFVAEMFAGSALIMSFAWLAATQASASARHLTWASAFGALLALPLFATILPSATHILLSAPPQETHRLPILIESVPIAAPLPPASGWSIGFSDAALFLGALWLAGVCAIALRAAVGAICLVVLERRSRPFVLRPGEEPQVGAAGQECELRLSETEMGPITWGFFHPIVLLPRTALFWPRERLQAVLLHELAHIRRRDSHALALAHLVCALYWPNPLVWAGARKMRREAEMAADDAVLNFGLKPSDYAGELLQLAHEFRTREPVYSGMALFMAGPPALEARVESVLSSTPSRSGVSPLEIVKVASLGFVAAAAICVACPSLAQDAPQPPTTSATTTPPEPATPPTPAAAPTPPQPDAVPNAPESSDMIYLDANPLGPANEHRMIIFNDQDLSKLSAADRKRMHIQVWKALAKVHTLVLMKPDMANALAQAQAGLEAARRAQPEIEKALAQAREELARAHIDQFSEARINEALARAEKELEAARVRIEHEEAEHPRRNESTPDEK